MFTVESSNSKLKVDESDALTLNGAIEHVYDGIERMGFSPVVISIDQGLKVAKIAVDLPYSEQVIYKIKGAP